MKEYIERASVHSIIERTSTFAFTRGGMHEKIDSLPTADVVEVTFCKDCRYYQDAKVNEKGFLICPASGMEITETDYCSYGALVDGKKTPTCHDGVCEIPGIEETDHA